MEHDRTKRPASGLKRKPWFLVFLIFCQENVEDWLNELGLDEYWENFTQSGYTEPRMLEDLKIMNKETVKETFRIDKPGHLDKMYKAIQKVQYPSEGRFLLSR